MKLKIGEPTLRLEDERLLRGAGCLPTTLTPGRASCCLARAFCPCAADST